MRLGINLFDLNRNHHPLLIVQMLLQDVVDMSAPVKVFKDRFDEACVVFTCDHVRAASICDVLRNKDRDFKQYPTRCYFSMTKGWTRLPHDAVLTRVVDGQVRLNSKWFPKEAKRASQKPAPKAERLELGESLL